ncbi:MAG TPA: SDR family NAD(P)-dependent oxidoreductase [Bryobacteraceae bacterium]|nr:SDR family NAD(P)-dependent oxidoreductase [Bryobacteraceae bacterium]
MDNRSKLAIATAGVAAGVFARRMYQSSRERLIGGSVALITGGSRGLGLALARRFAREGCPVAICARDEEELQRARTSLEERGARVMTSVCDVTNRSQVEQTISDVTAYFGRIDILVNNAGIIKVGPVEAMTIEDFEEAMNVIFWGTVNPTMTLLPTFLERNRGHIVNITSIGAKVSVPHLLPYSAAKYAAEGFSEGLRAELKGTGVKVTTIAPGLMRTGSYNAAMFKGDREAEAAWFSAGASMPGLSMSAERAACQIVAAVKRGDAERILTTQANVLARLKGVAPGLTQDLLGAAALLLLPQRSADKRQTPGWGLANLRSAKMRALLAFGRVAAHRFNQRTA